MIEMAIWVLIALAIIVFIIARRSDTRADKGAYIPGTTIEPGGTDLTTPTEGFEPFSGEVDGVTYVVEELADGTATVWLDMEVDVEEPFALSARDGDLKIECDKDIAARIDTDPDIRELLGLKSTYIDIGYNTNWVAAELPREIAISNKAVIEQVARVLLRFFKKQGSK
ncbi:MAG: hypothetical protein OEV59_04540 [Deltaproteobacteria bacterium]|nr:hypothetical protein [Deltaproteobacteria bacterium]